MPRELRRQVAAVLPPSIGLRLRALRSRRDLYGLHAPPGTLSDLVPAGQIAIDAGANRGLYTYWIGRRASLVHAFEPNPEVFSYLSRIRMRSVHAYNVALSDVEGTALLRIPRGSGDGEASIVRTSRSEESVVASVSTRPLDFYKFEQVGFLKIDVEGHEQELLSGARETILSSRPTIFIEIEDRHQPGAVARVSDILTSDFEYRYAYFLFRGRYHELSEFDLDIHQIQILPEVSSASYVNNFVFSDRKIS